jgi:hypothetical protein
MVPVAGQNAVLDASAIEREAHMRTAVVQGNDATTLFDNQNRAMWPADDLSSWIVPTRRNSVLTITPRAAGRLECCKTFELPYKYTLPASILFRPYALVKMDIELMGLISLT